MTDYKRAFKIACELLNGACLYGVDADSIFEAMMKKDGVVIHIYPEAIKFLKRR